MFKPIDEFIIVIFASSSSSPPLSTYISESATKPPKCISLFVAIDAKATSTLPEKVQFNILLFVARPTMPPKPAIVPSIELNKLVSLSDSSLATRTVKLLNNDPLSCADTPPNVSIVLPNRTELDTLIILTVSFGFDPHLNVILRNVASFVALNNPASSAFVGDKYKLYKIGIVSSSFCPIRIPVNSISNTKLVLFRAHQSLISISFTIIKLPSGSLIN